MFYNEHLFSDDDDEDDFIDDEDIHFIDEDIPDEIMEELLEQDIGIHTVCLEYGGSQIELTLKVTPQSWDGERHIDITDAFDIKSGRILQYPRQVIPPIRIEEAVDLLIWSFENDDDLSDEEREAFLSDFR